MIEKIKERIKKYTRKIGKAGLVITSLLCCTSTCFAGVQDSKIATGTQNLITELTNFSSNINNFISRILFIKKII